MEDFWNDVRALATSPVSSNTETASVLDLFRELIAHELPRLDADASQRCCAEMVASCAYQRDLAYSHEQLRLLLLTTDPLHKHEIEFVGSVILNDPELLRKLGQSTDAINAVIAIVWMFRFTQPRIVEKYMLILVAASLSTRLDTAVLDTTVTSAFVLYLFHAVCDVEETLTRSALLVLLALNHQYMLHDMHGAANKVFHELEQAPRAYTALGGTLVMRLNRSRDYDEDIKIIACKFFYLLFSTKQTADLLYTNDLDVLLGIVIRELNDLPTECVQTREMYLRVLYVMLVHSAVAQSSAHVRSTIVQTLRLITERVLEIDEKEDQAEMLRLAERCLAVKWLKWSSSDESSDDETERLGSNDNNAAVATADDSLGGPAAVVESFEWPPMDLLLRPASTPPSPPVRTQLSPPQSPRQSRQPLPRMFAGPPVSPRSHSLPRRRPPPPPPLSVPAPPPPRMRMPPPPPPPRHMSVESVGSQDSELSIDLVDHLRPPPAPPSRKLASTSISPNMSGSNRRN